MRGAVSSEQPQTFDSGGSTIRIRKASLADCPAIAQVQVEGWRTTYRGVVAEEYLENLSVTERTQKWVENVQVSLVTLVAENSDGQVVGFADGGAERTGRTDFRRELYAIYLLKNFRGNGLGRHLVRSVFDVLCAAGYESFLIWVLAENPYRRFYESLGGVVVAETKVQIGRQTLLEIAYGWRDFPGSQQ